MVKRKVCIVTGTRAEYGLLYWLMKEIDTDAELELQIVATGMQLSPEFGCTYKLIEADGFVISAKVEMLLSSDTAVGITKSIGLGVIGFAEVLERLKPDVMMVLGDRYEILAAAQAAMMARIPIAHIHGGEQTEGAVDEAIRHAVTKMSQLHFVSAEPYRKRVVQLGEQPEHVYNFGSPGLDSLRRLKLLSLNELECCINFPLGDKFFLVTYHPATMQVEAVQSSMQSLLDALDKFPDYKILFTKSNSDTGGRVLLQMIEQYANSYPSRVCVVDSLGQVRYFSALQYCTAVIGNSSSGILEAPFFGKPTVNMGDRQKGRLRQESILDCGEARDEIVDTILLAIQTKDAWQSLFGEAEKKQEFVAERICGVLKKVELQGICQKHFYDVKFEDECDE